MVGRHGLTHQGEDPIAERLSPEWTWKESRVQAAVRTESGVVVLDLQGRLDAASVREFRRVAHGQLRAGQRRLVVDLSGVESVDGMGLAGLVSFYRKAVANRGGR